MAEAAGATADTASEEEGVWSWAQRLLGGQGGGRAGLAVLAYTFLGPIGALLA